MFALVSWRFDVEVLLAILFCVLVTAGCVMGGILVVGGCNEDDAEVALLGCFILALTLALVVVSFRLSEVQDAAKRIPAPQLVAP